jgi:DNA-binding winged helix-turn-helix (wHTH) protein
MGAEHGIERQLLHARYVRIGGCRLDRSLNEIHGEGRCTRLMPKAAAVLEVLIHFSGQPVSKERLLLEVWRGEFPTEDVITNAISQLRKAFGDGARDSHYIRTVPRVGYALVAEVAPEGVPESEFDALELIDERLSEELELAPAAMAPAVAMPPSRAWLALLVVLLVLALALGAGILIGGARWRAKVARPHVVVPLSAQLVPHGVTQRRGGGGYRNFVASPLELRRDETATRWHLPNPLRTAMGDANGIDGYRSASSRTHVAAGRTAAANAGAADAGAGVAWPAALGGA